MVSEKVKGYFFSEALLLLRVNCALSAEDYYLQFNKKETAPRWPISPKGLIEQKPAPFFDHNDRIDLTKKLFADDAIVLKHLNSNFVSLKTDVNGHGLDFYFEGFPYLGLWAARNADFVCIEPWCGIADSVDHNQDLSVKEGIEKVASSESWIRTWSMRVF